MAQCGINGDPAVQKLWRDVNLKDEPAVESNQRGMVTYAKGGPDTRSTQFFINYGNNSFLDSMGFPPFGKIIEGMEVVDKFYSGYGEGAPNGAGPHQGKLQTEGNRYLKSKFPKLDFITKASIVEE